MAHQWIYIVKGATKQRVWSRTWDQMKKKPDGSSDGWFFHSTLDGSVRSDALAPLPPPPAIPGSHIPDEIVRIRSGQHPVQAEGHTFPGGTLTEKLPGSEVMIAEKMLAASKEVFNDVARKAQDETEAAIPKTSPGIEAKVDVSKVKTTFPGNEASKIKIKKGNQA